VTTTSTRKTRVMPYIRTLVGNINEYSGSSQVRVFHSPRAGGLGHQELFLDKAAGEGPTAGKIIQRMTNPIFIPAVVGKPKEIGGMLVDQTFSISDGEILKIFAHLRGGYGSRVKTANVFLRVREGAAVQKIRIKISSNPNAAFQYAEIEGAFDILDPDDVEATGVKMLEQFRDSMSLANRQRVISEVIVIQPEVKAVQKMVKKETIGVDGTKVVTFEVKRKRAIRTK